MTKPRSIPLIPLVVKERIEDSIISKKDCWLTSYGRNSKKPLINVNGTMYLLTRVSYRIYKGKEPGELYACHTCDNPHCINPDHLWLGTPAENMKDKVNKNRQPKGAAIPSSKLTEDKVEEIKNLLIEGRLTFKQIKSRFDIGTRTLSEINSGKRWSHVEGIGTRVISLQGWYEFRALCEAKSEKFGREFRVISRWEPTSQICSDCGFKWGKLDLSVRSVLCLNCGIQQDRDENAARNINTVGMRNRHDSKRTQRQSKTTSVASVDEASRITARSRR